MLPKVVGIIEWRRQDPAGNRTRGDGNGLPPLPPLEPLDISIIRRAEKAIRADLEQ